MTSHLSSYDIGCLIVRFEELPKTLIFVKTDHWNYSNTNLYQAIRISEFGAFNGPFQLLWICALFVAYLSRTLFAQNNMDFLNQNWYMHYATHAHRIIFEFLIKGFLFTITWLVITCMEEKFYKRIQRIIRKIVVGKLPPW